MSDSHNENTGSSHSPTPREPLFAYIVDRLGKDRALISRKGIVHVGVLRGSAVRWLGVAFEARGLRPFLPTDPSAADAALVISGDAADQLFASAVEPPSFDDDAFRMFGDQQLVRLFWRRCMSCLNPLALRIAAQTGTIS